MSMVSYKLFYFSMCQWSIKSCSTFVNKSVVSYKFFYFSICHWSLISCSTLVYVNGLLLVVLLLNMSLVS